MLARLHARPAAIAALAALVLAAPAGATPERAGSGGVWTPLAPMPHLRSLLGAATAPDGRVYAIGGFPATGGAGSTQVDVYDPAANTWSAATPLPQQLAYVSAATGRDGRIYAFGRCVTSCDVAGFAYDQRTDAWTQLPQMPHPRFGVAVAAGHDGRIYAIGGIDPAFNVYGEVDAYDPASNAWTPVAPLPGPRWDAAAAVGLDGTIYAIGGYGGPGQGSQVASAVAYDPLTNQWTTLAPLPQGLAETGATTAPDGRIYVAGGQIFKPATRKLAATNLVEVFNPATGGWKSGPKLPYRRDEHAFVTSGSQLLLIGGAGVRRDPVDTLALRP